MTTVVTVPPRSRVVLITLGSEIRLAILSLVVRAQKGKHASLLSMG
jgi:hypothetical protein